MKKLLTILFSLLSGSTVGPDLVDYAVVQRARDTLITDSLFKYQGVLIPVLDITYHEFSTTTPYVWKKEYVEGDRYMRFSNDVKETWYIMDLRGIEFQKIDTFDLYDSNKIRISITDDGEPFKTLTLPDETPQLVDTFRLVGDSLEISLSDDGVPPSVVDLSTLILTCEDILACVGDLIPQKDTTSYYTVCDTIYDTNNGFGLLYNWYAAADVRKITSSDDWVVPDSAQYATLLNHIDTYDSGSGAWLLAGGILKEEGFEYWNTPNEGAINYVGFNARGSGYRYGDVEYGVEGTFGFIKEQYNAIINELVDADSYYTLSLNEQEGAAYISSQFLKDAGSIRLLYTGAGTPTSYTSNDGHEYRVVTIGTQTWLADNLMETKYRNGDYIAGYDGGTYTPIANATWAALTTGALCAYEDNTELAFGVDTFMVECDTFVTTGDLVDYENPDLYVQYELIEENVGAFNFVSDTTINIEGIGYGGVKFKADTTVLATQYDLTQIAIEAAKVVGVRGVKTTISNDTIYAEYNAIVQTLSGTTDTLNTDNGLNGFLDISGNTTIHLDNLFLGVTGNITVLCDASGYTLQFTGGTVKTSPFVFATGGVITTTATAGAIDVYSYWYDGTYIIINGTKDYE